MNSFFWPSILQDVQCFCRHWEQCQRATRRLPLKAPLQPMPIIEQPFAWIAMDSVSPLPRSTRGHRFLLVIIDYATRYLEAISLLGMHVPGVARALLQLFSCAGLPKEILTDKGTSFTASLLKQLCRLLKVKQIFTMIYHPQTDGMVKRTNQTVKELLQKPPRPFLVNGTDT